MNLEQLRKKYADLMAKIKGFQDKETLTEDETKAFKSAIDEAKQCKADIEEAEKTLGDLDDLTKFASTAPKPAPVVSKTGSGGGKPDSNQTKGSHGEEVFQFDPDTRVLKTLYTDDPLYGSDKLKKLADDDYRKAFTAYLKSGGDMDRVDRESRKALSVGIDEDGGFLVPPQMLARVIMQQPGQTGVSDLVTIQPTTSAAVSMLRVQDTGEDIYGTVLRPQTSAEGRNPTEDDQDKLKPFTIQVHEEYTNVNLTRTFLEDAPGAVEQYVSRMFRNADRIKVEDKVLNGTGIGQAYGIMTRIGETYGPDTRNVGNPVDLDELIEAYYELPAQYAANARLAMKRSSFGVLNTLQDGAGAYAFGQMSVYDGQAIRPTENFKGTPMTFSDLMPAMGAANKFALYGDFAETYMMVLRLGLSVRFRDLADEGTVKVVFRKRWGGDVMFGRAMKAWVQS